MGLYIYYYKAKRSAYHRYLAELEKYKEEVYPSVQEIEHRARTENMDLTDEEIQKYDALMKKKPCLDDYLLDVGYFRKVNFLVRYFDYSDNCSFLEITKEQMSELLEECREVLDKCDEETSSKLLPTLGGFFYGSTEYDQWYYDSVRRVKDWVESLLPLIEENEVIYMYCWW